VAPAHGHAVHAAAALLVALLALDAALLVLRPPPAPVRVSEVEWQVFGYPVGNESGFSARSSAEVTLSILVTDGCSGCSVPLHFAEAFVNTTGFSVVSWSLPPIAVGATGELNVTVRVPAGAYSGPLAINLD